MTLHIMELHFVAMSYFNLGNKNAADVGHIKCSRRLYWPAGCRFPTPDLKVFVYHVHRV